MAGFFHEMMENEFMCQRQSCPVVNRDSEKVLFVKNPGSSEQADI